MSRARIPLTFRIYRGQELVREETLSQPVIKIGKLSSSHLRLDHDHDVSRMHAVIEVDAAGECKIVDLGSTRGTFVNGQKITKTALRPGDRIEVGQTRIEVSMAAPATVSDDRAPAPGAPTATVARVQRPAQPVPPTPPARPVTSSPTRALARMPAPQSMVSNRSTVAIVGAASEPSASGDRAIEIAAMLGDSVVGVQHLSDPRAGRVSRFTYALFAVGAAMLAMAGIAFAVGVQNAEFNKSAKEAWVQHHNVAHDWRPQLLSPVYDWMAFGGLGAGLVGLTWGLVRIRRERGTASFRIGSGADVEFATSAAPGESFALVAPRGDDWVCNFTQDMNGELTVDGDSMPLASLASQGRAQASASIPGALEVAIPERGRIRIDAGQNTFMISAVARPKKQAVPLLGAVENRALAFFAGSAVVHLGLWAFLNTLPPAPESLAMDFSDGSERISRVTSKGNEEPPAETEPLEEPTEAAGGTGTAMALESGKMGTEKSNRKTGRYAMERTSETPRVSREEAMTHAREAGILGVLRRNRGSTIAALTGGADISSGLDDADIFGGLLGDEAGEMNGGFGFGRSGFGPGGGGTGWGTIAAGTYGTIGHGAGTGTGYSVGTGRGLESGRQPKAPTVEIGHAVPTEGLDKNIIRRYIRRQLPRIKYCYEKQLIAHPGLSGTVLANFQISPVGQVISSKAGGVSDEVSSCVAEVISTIDFPKPKNGLLVHVKYPFTFRPSGG